jgi:hypothetical protein
MQSQAAPELPGGEPLRKGATGLLEPNTPSVGRHEQRHAAGAEVRGGRLESDDAIIAKPGNTAPSGLRSRHTEIPDGGGGRVGALTARSKDDLRLLSFQRPVSWHEDRAEQQQQQQLGIRMALVML